MRLSGILAAAARAAVRPTHADAIDEGRCNEPALFAFRTADGILAALQPRGQGAEDRRDPIVRALVRQHRFGLSPVWAHLLLAAFTPMLLRIRTGLGRAAASANDLDQVVMHAFLEALESVPTQESVRSMAGVLRSETQFRALRMAARERSAEQMLARLRDWAPLVSVVAEPAMGALDDEAAVAAWLRLATRDQISPRRLDVLVATVVGDEPLSVYVERTVGGSAKERCAAYERVKRERQRTLREIRPLLENSLSPSA
jgi:hypothetical protein